MLKSDHNIEIMAPAGSFESLSAALRAGADSVYFGVGHLNMRARSSSNFSRTDLKRIVRHCHSRRVKAYLALNTVVYDEEQDEVERLCQQAAESEVDAIIAADPAAIMRARAHGLPVHMSVQANVCNLAAVKLFAAYADVMVLARELNLRQISRIITGIREECIVGPSGHPIRIELFAHGALCVSISGRCYMSLAQFDASANRGACLQSCRRSYLLTDETTGEQLRLENSYVMSPKDICTIGVIDQLLEAGVDVLKIEGRGRSADYVYKVTRAYREAVDSCRAQTFSPIKVEGWRKELESVFNRGFWQGGYYLGEHGDEWAGSAGSRAAKVKHHAGKVNKFFPRVNVAEISLEADGIECGDELLITGATTGAQFLTVREIRIDGIPCPRAAKGAIVSLPVPEKVRANDKVYLLRPRRLADGPPNRG